MFKVAEISLFNTGGVGGAGGAPGHSPISVAQGREINQGKWRYLSFSEWLPHYSVEATQFLTLELVSYCFALASSCAHVRSVSSTWDARVSFESEEERGGEVGWGESSKEAISLWYWTFGLW